jgi:hypothetical protein
MHGFMQTSFFFSAPLSQTLSHVVVALNLVTLRRVYAMCNMCSLHLAPTVCLHCRLHGMHLLWAVPDAGVGRLEVQPLVYTAYIQGEGQRSTPDA